MTDEGSSDPAHPAAAPLIRPLQTQGPPSPTSGRRSCPAPQSPNLPRKTAASPARPSASSASAVTRVEFLVQGWSGPRIFSRRPARFRRARAPSPRRRFSAIAGRDYRERNSCAGARGQARSHRSSARVRDVLERRRGRPGSSSNAKLLRAVAVWGCSAPRPSLENRQRALIKRPRGGEVTLGTQQTREGIEAYRRLGMLGSEGLLINRQRALSKRARAAK